jgi:hypothetical protein
LPANHFGNTVFWQAAPLDFRFPEVPPAHQGMVASPFNTAFDTWPLNAPENFICRIAASRDTPPRHFHLLCEGVQHTNHQHTLRSTIERRTHTSGNLITAVQHTGMRENQYTSLAQCGRKIPLLRFFQMLQCAFFAQFGMFACIKFMNVALQFVSVQVSHHSAPIYISFAAVLPYASKYRNKHSSVYLFRVCGGIC